MFEGRVAVVTGGASGVGRALVAALAERGARVVMADVDRSALEAESRTLRQRGLAVEGVEVDVTSAGSVEALAARVFEAYGAVHFLFNNAGVGVKEAARPLWTLPEVDWRWAYAVNVMGAVHGVRAFVPKMIEGGERGYVINTSSANGGLYSLPTTPVYASSKAALTSLTEVLQMQLVREKTRLSAHLLFPGPHLVNTNILNSERVRAERFRAAESEPAAYVDMRALAEKAGVDLRLTEPEEVAEMALDGLRAGSFWILSSLGTAEEKLKKRVAEILARENPEPG